ncbi:MAG TPA: plastocyanin/azurin family copper-binding protein [Solirubrobacterales bacterium]|nr:plastocyanin/azurin family copper-binding protein [Solirubrobacterales bacterium]
MQVGQVRRLTRVFTLVAVAALAVSAMAVAGLASPLGKAASPKIVKVKDDFYKPDKVRVKKRGKVRWKWTDGLQEVHNVTLLKGPSGVKKSKFRSQTTSSPDYRFTKRFKKVGKYKFYCTIHPDVMRMKVVVHR